MHLQLLGLGQKMKGTTTELLTEVALQLGQPQVRNGNETTPQGVA